MILNFLIFIVFTVNTVLSVGILLRNPKAKVNQLYVGFVTFLDLFILTNFLENEPGLVGLENLDLMLRLDFAFAIFFFYYWFRFSTAFVKSKLYFYKQLNRNFFILTVIFALLSLFTSSIITDIAFYDNVIHFKGGSFWFIYALLILFWSIGGLVILSFGRKRAKVAKNFLKVRQIRFVFWGYIISMGNLTVINLFLQTFPGVSLEVSRLGIYGMTIMVLFTAYAITRQRLFELKIIIARAVSFVILISLMAVAYAVVLFIGAQRVFGTKIIDIRLLVGAVVLTVIAVLTFPPILHLMRRLTNKIFFKGEYDSDELHSKLASIMAETIELEYMTKQVLKKLTQEMNITKAAFLIIDNHKITDIKNVGYKEEKLASPELEKLLHKSSNQHFIFEDLEEEVLKNLFYKLDISVAIPMKIKNDDVAILILGSKASGEIYYKRDIDFLDTLASEAGIAIQNAKAYLKIQRFSKELEKRVEERTRELEESQKRELAKARDIARLKDEFVFVAVHELRAPIIAIKGFLQLVSDSKKNFPKDVRDHLEAISSASDNMNQLVNDLLEIARSEVSTKIEVKPADIISIINSIVKELSSLASQENITVRVKKQDKIPLVLINEQKTKEVITNLLSNAIKYNREGGKVDINVYPTVTNNEPMVIVEFRDTGYGIPKKEQGKIFQKFFRAATKATQKVLGTGLGLFIARMLVEKMGGKITFTSEEGKGSIFVFSLHQAKN